MNADGIIALCFGAGIVAALIRGAWGVAIVLGLCFFMWTQFREGP